MQQGRWKSERMVVRYSERVAQAKTLWHSSSSAGELNQDLSD